MTTVDIDHLLGLEEIRQLLDGGFRILFTVQEDQVRILHIRHRARRPLVHQMPSRRRLVDAAALVVHVVHEDVLARAAGRGIEGATPVDPGSSGRERPCRSLSCALHVQP